MGTTSTTIDADARAFIAAQQMFFVATAPPAPQEDGGQPGHVNLSPKGLDGTFAVLDERTVAYLDMTGSGIETLAHVKAGSSICLMFCAFTGAPKILRLYGSAEPIEPGHPEWEALLGQFPELPGTRAILRVAVSRVATSCGYGIPIFEYQGQRETLTKWGRAKGPDQIRAYQDEHNLQSIDGLPGLDR